MLASIGRALARGVEPGHLARALQRVLDDGEIKMHCEIVRTAVKQAWADQRAGMCPECGADPGEHDIGCPIRAAETDATGADEAEIRHLIFASLAEAQASVWASAQPVDEASAGLQRDADADADADAQPDPLQPYLDLAVMLEPDSASEVIAAWLTSQIAGRLVDVDVDDVAGRRRALDRSAAWWASRIPVEQHDAIDLAAAQLHFALSTSARRAS